MPMPLALLGPTASIPEIKVHSSRSHRFVPPLDVQPIVPKLEPSVPIATLQNIPLSTATPLEVGKWLTTFGEAYQVYEQHAIRHSFNGEILHSIIAQDGWNDALEMIKSLEITNGVHQRRILLALGKVSK